MTTISEALAIAIQHHHAGRLQAAEQIYRQILAAEPDHAQAWYLLGVVNLQTGNHQRAVECMDRALEVKADWPEALASLGSALRQQGKLDEAVRFLQRAVQLKPDFALAHNNLGAALSDRGRLDEAVGCFRRASDLNPSDAETHNNLGIALNQQGKPREAIAAWRRALELKPGLAAAHSNLGNALMDQGQIDEAIACYRRALELRPGYAEAHNNLGNALKNRGRLDEAIACYRRAVELKPDYAGAHDNLGTALKDQGKLDEAAACYRRALELSPDYAEAHYNLGNALSDLGRVDEVVACYRRALELKPDYAAACNNLGNTFKDQGQLDEAIACYRHAMELKPEDAAIHSNLVYTQLFHPGCDVRTLYEEHRRWNRQHAEPLRKLVQPHANDGDPRRKLRVGYVSPDFRGHPVGRFLLPLLESHDRQSFEIYCYASVRVADAMTGCCRARADVWRDVHGLSDEQVASTVRKDQIDILVDLTMHMSDNRLLVFARKPAPVQVTYLAYCGTTGLGTMDYRLTDPYLDPPGQYEPFYSEQSIRLPETYWCYRPPMETPPVKALPALEAGHVRFGSLNNFCKVSSAAMAAWSRLLQAVPGSSLLLHARAGSHRDRVRAFLAGQGIGAERLAFADLLPPADYFDLYQRIDVALDTFPYGGGTTTCDALWMGVPVVSLAGQTAVGRGGVSILSNVGLPELVARDPQQYVRIAVELASDLPRLSQLRATLRDRMEASPLMNAPRFARNVEAAYRDMWQCWCART